MSSRPNCFQIVVQHFSEEQYIFYFAGEAPEHAQVKKEKKKKLEATKNDGSCLQNESPLLLFCY